MIRKEKEGISWLEFENLQGINHAILLRHGGESQAPFDSLNMSHHCGDEERAVNANWEKVKAVLGIERLKGCIQTHGDKVVAVNAKSENETADCDTIATDQPDIALMVRHADCQAAIFYDPAHKAIANVHAGWRGNVQNIYAKTVAFMREKYGTDPSELIVGISPSLGPCHAEFRNYRDELPESFWKFKTESNHFDLWKVAEEQLHEAGVNNIEIARECTFANKDDFFSFRRDQTTGRHATLVWLHP